MNWHWSRMTRKRTQPVDSKQRTIRLTVRKRSHVRRARDSWANSFDCQEKTQSTSWERKYTTNHKRVNSSCFKKRITVNFREEDSLTGLLNMKKFAWHCLNRLIYSRTFRHSLYSTLSALSRNEGISLPAVVFRLCCVLFALLFVPSCLHSFLFGFVWFLFRLVWLSSVSLTSKIKCNFDVCAWVCVWGWIPPRFFCASKLTSTIPTNNFQIIFARAIP